MLFDAFFNEPESAGNGQNAAFEGSTPPESTTPAPLVSIQVDRSNSPEKVTDQMLFNAFFNEPESAGNGHNAAFEGSTPPALSLVDMLDNYDDDDEISRTRSLVGTISSGAAAAREGSSPTLRSTASHDGNKTNTPARDAPDCSAPDSSNDTMEYTPRSRFRSSQDPTAVTSIGAYASFVPNDDSFGESKMFASVGTNDLPYVEDESMYGQVMSRGLAILSCMTDYQWGVLLDDGDYDDDEEEEDEDDEEEADLRNAFFEEEDILLDEELNPSDAVSETDVDSVTDEDSVTEEDLESEMLVKMEALLSDAFSGDIALTAEDYNLIILNMACTSAYKDHDIMTMLMQILTHMNSAGTEAHPDGFTYAILILALSTRGQAPIMASRLVLDMMHERHLFHNRETLVQAMRCLELCKRREQGEQLLRPILKKNDGEIPIPVDAVIPLLRMYQFEQKTGEAMTLIDDYIAIAGQTLDLSGLFRTAVKWPRYHSNAKADDVKKMYAYLFNIFKSCENKPGMRIHYYVWGMLIDQLAKSSSFRVLSAETEMIRDGIKLLLEKSYTFYPNAAVLKHGLEVAACHADAELAVDLFQRLLSEPLGRREQRGTFSVGGINSETNKSVISPHSFKLAMNACVDAKCASSISTLLTMLEHPDVEIPSVLKSQFMNQAIVGFVGALEYDKAMATMTAVGTEGLGASDDACGAVIQGYALDGRPNEALQLFQDIETGVFGGAKAGPLCYTAKMLALMQLKDWQAVIDLQVTMKELDMPSSSIVVHGVVLASMRLGDKGNVVEAIEQGIRSGVPLNLSCFKLTLKCLFPDLVSGSLSIPTIRAQLRERVDVAPASILTQHYLNLSGALRAAQIEEDRVCSRNVGAIEISKRRHAAWIKAHQSLLDLHRSAS